jgi:hypothetical protein
MSPAEGHCVCMAGLQWRVECLWAHHWNQEQLEPGWAPLHSALQQDPAAPLTSGWSRWNQLEAHTGLEQCSCVAGCPALCVAVRTCTLGCCWQVPRAPMWWYMLQLVHSLVPLKSASSCRASGACGLVHTPAHTYSRWAGNAGFQIPCVCWLGRAGKQLDRSSACSGRTSPPPTALP